MAEKRKDNKGRILRDGEGIKSDGRYRFQYTDSNGTRHEVCSWKLVETDRTPPGKRDDLSLREKEKMIMRDLADGIKTAVAKKVALNDLFEVYLSGKVELKQSTRSNYKYMFNEYVRDSLGKKRIDSIKFSDVKRFYNSLIYDRRLRPNSIENIQTVLHPVFTLAVRDGYIRSNPTDGIIVELKKGANWEKPKRHALTVAEQEAFINFIAESETYNHWLPLFTVFLGTGCRVGEIIGLRWCDCDFDKGIISINHNMVYRVQDNGHSEMHVTTPKTSAGCREVPMLKEVRAALMEERKKQFREGRCTVEIDGYSGFVFTNRFGYIHNPSTINRAIQRIYTAYNEQEQERAKKEHREPLLINHFSVHNLRHTFCTRFCENESNVKIIQEIMGHSDIQTTMNVYAEVTREKKKQSFENLEGKIKIS